jgi:phosphatidylglycerol:prolipoprotein diacylglycerol transferase
VGFLLSFFLVSRRTKGRGWDPEIVVDLYLLCTVGAVLLARVFYVVTYPEPFLANPALIPQIWKGGITYYGSLVGMLASAWAYCKVYKLPVGEVIDLFSPYLALAHALGRLGCYLNGCCYGIASEVTWAVVFPQDRLQLARHPAQLYEAGFEFLNFLILDQMWRRGIRGGRVTLAWIALYAAQRFMLEFVRGDTLSESYLFGTTFGQTVAIGMTVVAVIGALRLRPYSEEELARLEPSKDAPEAEAEGK